MQFWKRFRALYSIFIRAVLASFIARIRGGNFMNEKHEQDFSNEKTDGDVIL